MPRAAYRRGLWGWARAPNFPLQQLCSFWLDTGLLGTTNPKQASLSLPKPWHLAKGGLLIGSPAGWAKQGFC